MNGGRTPEFINSGARGARTTLTPVWWLSYGPYLNLCPLWHWTTRVCSLERYWLIAPDRLFKPKSFFLCQSRCKKHSISLFKLYISRFTAESLLHRRTWFIATFIQLSRFASELWIFPDHICLESYLWTALYNLLAGNAEIYGTILTRPRKFHFSFTVKWKQATVEVSTHNFQSN